MLPDKFYSPLVVLLLTLSFSSLSTSQVDPFWLRSWEDALAKKPSVIESKVRIKNLDDSGIPFVIHGQIFEPDGLTPASEVVIHIYHRDSEGFEFGPDEKNYPIWGLQGWVKSDDNGNFEIQTIRPAPDHLGREGAHIHFTTVSDEYGKQWASKVLFWDDPLVSESLRDESKTKGKFGAVRRINQGENVQYIDVNIKQKAAADF